ncbi:MAG: RNA polymerase sigma factor [Acidobacteria bacterium]|nr:RNA polymerase sigma factor [Acidobacteriota bacterium]
MAETPANDAGVLVAARGGSSEAGRRIVDEHGPSMLRTAWHVLGRYGGSDADDVVQEALIAALTTPALPQGDLGAWLRAITVRKALDFVRGRRRQREREEEFAATHPGAATTDPSRPADVLALREALARLAPADRAVLVLVDLEGHSMAEAATALGTTNVAMRLRAARARRKLAALLKRLEVKR